MKKAIVLVSAFVLMAGLTFAQNPQTPAKTTTTKTETKATTAPTKDSKSCDTKTAKDCPASKSCCAHDKSAPAPEKKTEAKPDKK